MMDRSRLGIVLVVDEERRLLGTVTDGDLRRAMLARVELSRPVEALLEQKAGSAFSQPISAALGQDPNWYLQLLQRHGILHLPILDQDQRVVGLVTRDEFLPRQLPPLQAVIMAGGKGSRLYPLTEQTPKPMLPVGDKPLLEIIIAQLRESGIKRVNVSTHHQREKIESHFGDGQQFGVELSYVTEDRPLGTAGCLGLIESPRETTLVINGDILTQVNFHAMLQFHRTQQADLTVAVRQYDVQVPFGVVESDGAAVRGVTEKPVFNFFVNAGIYLLEPSVYRLLSPGERMDMTDLIQRLLHQQRRVASFPIRECWLDIGQPADYEHAQQLIKEWEQDK
jgi:dTDP-glucose pyrophosphorylase